MYLCPSQGQAGFLWYNPKPKPERGPERHQLRIWINMALQSGLIDRQTNPKLRPMWDAWIDSLER